MSLFTKSTLSSYWVGDYRRTFKERPQKNIQFSRITFCPAASELRLSDQTGDQSTDSWMLSCHSSGVQKTKNYPSAPVSTADENAQCRSKTYLHPKQGQKQERWGMWISIIKQTSDQMKKSLAVCLSLSHPPSNRNRALNKHDDDDALGADCHHSEFHSTRLDISM